MNAGAEAPRGLDPGLQRCLGEVLRVRKVITDTGTDRFGEAPRSFLDLAGLAIQSLAEAVRDHGVPPLDSRTALAQGVAWGLLALRTLDAP